MNKDNEDEKIDTIKELKGNYHLIMKILKNKCHHIIASNKLLLLYF